MKQKYRATGTFAFSFVAFLEIALVAVLLSCEGGAVPSEASEAPSSSVTVVEPGYPAEKPADAQQTETETRSVTVGDGSLPPVPVRVVRRITSGDTAPQLQPEFEPLAVPVSGDEPVSAQEEASSEVVPIVASLDFAPLAVTSLSPDIPTTTWRPAPTTGAEVGRWQPRRNALIVADAGALLDPNAREEGLSKIVGDKFTRLLLAFGPDTLRTLHTPDGSQQLYNLLRSAEEKNIQVDLLLKTPRELSTWAWDGTNSLIAFFRPFPFRSVQLDIDTSALADGQSAEQLAAAIQSTVMAAGKPVGIVLDNPRILEGPFGDYVASAFYRMNLNDVALKMYSTNAEEVAARFQAICRFYVDLPFSLVQSVKSALPRTESYFTAGVTIFGRRMKKLCFDTSTANAQDLIFDSWEDYAQMAR